MNIEDLFEVRLKINGTISVFPNRRTVTITPSLPKSCDHEVKRYDFGCFDKETLDLLQSDPTSIIYSDEWEK